MLHEILAFRKLTGGKHRIVGISPPFRVWAAEHVFDTSHSDDLGACIMRGSVREGWIHEEESYEETYVWLVSHSGWF